MIPEEFHAKSFTQHREAALTNNLIDDDISVSSAVDWCNYFYGDSNKLPDDVATQLNFFGYYRWYPAQQQDVAIVGTNPSSNTATDEVIKFCNLAGDLPAIRDFSIETLAGWLDRNQAAFTGTTKSNNRAAAAGILEIIADETDAISHDNLTSAINQDGNTEDSYYRNGFHEDVFYTNVCKLATPDSGALNEDAVRKHSVPLLKEELDLVKPDIVLMLGKAYEMVLDSGEDITISEEHGLKKQFAGYDVVPVVHPTAYSGNLSSGETDPDVASARFRKTIQELV